MICLDRYHYFILMSHPKTAQNFLINKSYIDVQMLKGCGGGSDVCRSLAAYGTATKAEQKLIIG